MKTKTFNKLLRIAINNKTLNIYQYLFLKREEKKLTYDHTRTNKPITRTK